MDYSIKKLGLMITLIFSSTILLPAHAWPEVDHMNMCGAATKVVRSYSGNFRTWAAHDNYVSYLGDMHYLLKNCPKIKASKGSLKKKKAVKTIAKTKTTKVVKKTSNTRRPAYDEHADCLRVDRLNGLGLSNNK